MSDNNSAASGGVSFSGLLGIAFIILKLTNVINWPWLWVLSPLWIPAAIIILGFGVYLLAMWRKSIDTKKRLAAGMNEYAWKNRKKRRPEIIEPKSRWQERMEELRKNKNDL